MKNKEIEELLNKAKDIAKYGTDGKQHTRMFNQFEAKALLSYIEQLENNRDKAIEICDFYNKKYQKDPLGNQKVLFVINNIKDILKGGSDEQR